MAQGAGPSLRIGRLPAMLRVVANPRHHHLPAALGARVHAYAAMGASCVEYAMIVHSRNCPALTRRIIFHRGHASASLKARRWNQANPQAFVCIRVTAGVLDVG